MIRSEFDEEKTKTEKVRKAYQFLESIDSSNFCMYIISVFL